MTPRNRPALCSINSWLRDLQIMFLYDVYISAPPPPKKNTFHPWSIFSPPPHCLILFHPSTIEECIGNCNQIWTYRSGSKFCTPKSSSHTKMYLYGCTTSGCKNRFANHLQKRGGNYLWAIQWVFTWCQPCNHEMFGCMEGHIIIPLGLASMLDVDNTIIPVKLTPLINRIVIMEQDYGEVLSRKLQRTERRPWKEDVKKFHEPGAWQTSCNIDWEHLHENCKAYIWSPPE